MNLLDLLKEFRHGKSHIAFITENIEGLQNKLGLNRRNSVLHPALINEELLKQFYSGSTSTKTSAPKEDIKILGIITLEDVIEEMINIQILDEDDYEDQKKTSSSNTNNRRKTVKANLKSSSKYLIKILDFYIN